MAAPATPAYRDPSVSMETRLDALADELEAGRSRACAFESYVRKKLEDGDDRMDRIEGLAEQNGAVLKRLEPLSDLGAFCGDVARVYRPLRRLMCLAWVGVVSPVGKAVMWLGGLALAATALAEFLVKQGWWPT